MQYVQRNRRSKETKLTRSYIEHLINEYVLNERDRKIVKRRLIDGIFFEPLAEEFGLSERQVKNIVYKYEKIMFT